MSTGSILTRKGQVTVPKSIREKLGIRPGHRVIFTLMPDGTVLLRIKNKSIKSLAGSLRKKWPKGAPVEQLSR